MENKVVVYPAPEGAEEWPFVLECIWLESY